MTPVELFKPYYSNSLANFVATAVGTTTPTATATATETTLTNSSTSTSSLDRIVVVDLGGGLSLILI